MSTDSSIGTSLDVQQDKRWAPGRHVTPTAEKVGELTARGAVLSI